MNDRREIWFVNLTVFNSKGKLEQINQAVLTAGESYYKNKFIHKLELITKLGFQNSNVK